MAFGTPTSYAASGAGRAWQGCATDGTTVWLISDRTAQTAPYGLQNNIDIYTASDMTLSSTQSAVYTGTDASARLMNFVDGTYYGGKVWITATNWHSKGTNSEDECCILEFDPSDWSVTRHNITSKATASGSIESIARRGSEWWLCWSDQNKAFRYDASWNFIASYTLPQGATPYGDASVKWFQGLQWMGDILIANLHGANTVAEATYAPGCEMYLWNGSTFSWLRTLTPPTYGSGQGFCVYGNTFWFADRVEADIVKVSYQQHSTSGAWDSAAARWHRRISKDRTPVAVVKSAARTAIETLATTGSDGASLSSAAVGHAYTAIYEA